MTLTPKITFVFCFFFISNLDPINNFVLRTLHVPKINISLIYKRIIAHLPFTNLGYSHLSTLLVEKSSQSKILLSFCHCFDSFFYPYKGFKSWYTLFS